MPLAKYNETFTKVSLKAAPNPPSPTASIATIAAYLETVSQRLADLDRSQAAMHSLIGELREAVDWVNAEKAKWKLNAGSRLDLKS